MDVYIYIPGAIILIGIWCGLSMVNLYSGIGYGKSLERKWSLYVQYMVSSFEAKFRFFTMLFWAHQSLIIGIGLVHLGCESEKVKWTIYTLLVTGFDWSVLLRNIHEFDHMRIDECTINC